MNAIEKQKMNVTKNRRREVRDEEKVRKGRKAEGKRGRKC